MKERKKKLRACFTCEYFREATFAGADHFCQYALPTHPPEGKTQSFPKVRSDDWCSKWEPEWKENETIMKAWKEFEMIAKLADNRDEK